jgi:serine/threonine protein kinase
VGEGGFGKVYRVKHKLDSNIYAVKKTVVNYEDLNDRKMLKEVALLSKLNHPNIVRYYQSWLEETESIEQLIDDMSFNEDTKINELK